jgi:serine/threonine protein kinase
VRLVYNTQDGHYYAMKVMNKSLLKKRRIMGFSAGSSASASRTASLGGQGGSLASLRNAMAAAGAGGSASLSVLGSAAGGTAAGSGCVVGSGSLVPTSLSAASDHWTNVQREIAILKKCRHPNVVRLVEVMDDPQNDCLYLVMEHMAHGALLPGEFDQLHALPIGQVRQYFRDILLGLEYLHANKIIHVSCDATLAQTAAFPNSRPMLTAVSSSLCPYFFPFCFCSPSARHQAREFVVEFDRSRGHQ